MDASGDNCLLKNIDFVYFDAGGGHRAAATALLTVTERQGRPWRVRLVNLQEILDSLDIFRRIMGIRLEDIYNLVLRKGWTLGSAQMLVAMHGIIRLYHRAQVRLLTEFWRRDTPDMVVSLVPNFNRAMWQAIQALNPAIPYVTVITDFADYPPHFWMERQEPLLNRRTTDAGPPDSAAFRSAAAASCAPFLVCGTERAVAQARQMGYRDERIFLTSGMILRPGFYDAPEIDVAAERVRLGLRADLPTGLVLFGGAGSTAMTQIARELDRSAMPLQLIFICGRNVKLRERLTAMPLRYPRIVEGFTGEIPYYMRLADFFIGKPGPGSISEALAMKLPVVVVSNAWTLPQERYNAEWVREKQVGAVLRSFGEIERGIAELLEPAQFARFRANAAAVQNRAVFEIPRILEKIVANHSSTQ
jgi:1,2-diacylglycerol 3-beta-galactosyltransferase